jgi:DNA-binding CsgD family transcriptional regulator
METIAKVARYFNWRTIGFSLNRAWVFLLFLGIGTSSISSTSTIIPSSVYTYSSIVLVVVLLAGFFFRSVVENLLARSWFRWFAVASTVVGTIFATTLSLEDVSPTIIGLLAGASTGFGSGVITLAFGKLYSMLPPEDAGIETPLAFLIATVIYACVVLVIPSGFDILLVNLVALAAGFILCLYPCPWNKSSASTETKAEIEKASFRSILHVGLCACGVSIADGLSRSSFMAATGILSQDMYANAMLPSAVISSVVLIGFAVLFRKSEIKSLYRVIVGIILISMVFTPVFATPDSKDIGPLFILVGYNTFNVFIWIILSDLTYNFKISPVAAFGLGWGMLSLGHTIGQILSTFLNSTAVYSSQIGTLTTAIAVTLVFVSCMFVLRDNDLVSTKDLSSLVDSVGKAIDETIEPVETSHEENEGEVSSLSLSGENPVAKPIDVVEDFHQRCMSIAHRCSLTPRETEIFLLLARGRTSSWIRNELYISKGTAATHMQHIYQKLQIHSRQELFDMIENEILETH